MISHKIANAKTDMRTENNCNRDRLGMVSRNQNAKGSEMTGSIRTYMPVRPLQGKRLTALWEGFQNS